MEECFETCASTIGKLCIIGCTLSAHTLSAHYSVNNVENFKHAKGDAGSFFLDVVQMS